MTITTSVNKIIAPGDAIQVDFPYDFIVLAESHMNVYLDGVLEDTANWSMTGLGDQAGGVVTMTSAPGDGVKVTLLRIVPNTQLTDYSAYGSFPAETHERALDLRVMEAQQLQEAGGRALKAPIDDDGAFNYSLPTPVAGKSWKINGTNDAIILTDGDPDQAQSDAAAQVVLAEAAKDASVVAKDASVVAKDASVAAQGLSEDARDAAVVAQVAAEAAEVGAIGAVVKHYRNLLINGNFAINQEVVSGTVVLAAGEYGHDGFKGGAAGCTYTFAIVENITTLTISAGSLIQIADGEFLQSGTYILSWSGTCQGKIDGGSYSSSGVTGTLTGGTNASIEFNTGTLSLVQLEKGIVATDFEFRDDELRRCQYYFAKQPVYLNFDDAASTGAGYRTIIPHITPMKSTPTYGAFDQIVLTGWSNIAFFSSSNIKGYVVGLPTAVGPTSRVTDGTIDADARL